MSSPAIYSWGIPGPGATIIATKLENPSHAVIYAYEKGSMLVDGKTQAPARRVYFMMDDTTFGALNSDGRKLFDAAVNYALGRPPAAQTKFIPPTMRDGKLVLSWSGNGVLQKADSVTGPWSDIPNVSSPHAVTLSAERMFYRLKQ